MVWGEYTNILEEFGHSVSPAGDNYSRHIALVMGSLENAFFINYYPVCAKQKSGLSNWFTLSVYDQGTT